ncbi:MAG: hypothetical protein WAO50_01815 [Candidatus Nanopelagicales bacterium]
MGPEVGTWADSEVGTTPHPAISALPISNAIVAVTLAGTDRERVGVVALVVLVVLVALVVLDTRVVLDGVTAIMGRPPRSRSSPPGST